MLATGFGAGFGAAVGGGVLLRVDADELPDVVEPDVADPDVVDGLRVLLDRDGTAAVETWRLALLDAWRPLGARSRMTWSG